MSETLLKRITTPALGPSFGHDVNESFKNIDDNFGTLSNHELYRGQPGESLISLNVPFSELLDDDSTFNWPESGQITYVIAGQKTNFINMFKDVKESLGGTVVDANSDVDILRSIDKLKNSDGTVLICFNEPEDINNPVDIVSIIPYVFVDDTFWTTEFSDSGVYDLSGTITYNIELTNPWKCTQNFPTLYYDAEEEKLCWIINGTQTHIPASGPQGITGKSGMTYVALTDTPPTDWPTGGSNTTLNISYLLDWNPMRQIPWIAVSDLTLDQIPDDGSPVIVIPNIDPSWQYTQDYTEDVVKHVYFISSIINENGTLYALVDEKCIIYAKMNDTTLWDSMHHIKEVDLDVTPQNDPQSPLSGYIIKDATEGNTGYVLHATKEVQSSYVIKKVILDRVNNLDGDPNSPLNLDNTQYRLKISGNNSVEIGDQTTASGAHSHAEGRQTIASGAHSHAEGYGTIASTTGSHAEGTGTQANNTYSHAEGQMTRALGDASHAEGFDTEANKSYAHAEGNGTTASGNASHAEGNDGTMASGNASHAEGTSTIARGDASHTEGNETETGINAAEAHAEGNSTHANGRGSHAEGSSTYAEGNYSHAEGVGSEAKDIGAHAAGYNTEAKGRYSHTEGSITKAMGYASHAEGDGTMASGNASHAEGADTITNENYSHAEGNNTIAVGEASHTEGKFTIAGATVLDYDDYTKGCKTFYDSSISNTTPTLTSVSLFEFTFCIEIPEPVNSASDILIPENDCTAIRLSRTIFTNQWWDCSDISVISVGSYNGNYYAKIKLTSSDSNLYTKWQSAINNILHPGTVGFGYYICFPSITINETIYSGGPQYMTFNNSNYTHTEGIYTCSDGIGAHAEGFGNISDPIIAIGNGAHVEGVGTKAIGQGAHAEGYHTEAYGDGAHASGYSTKTLNNGEIALGRYNAPGYLSVHTPSGVYCITKTGSDDKRIIFSIGCGNSANETGTAGTTDHRTNAMFITAEGTTYVKFTPGNYSYWDGDNNHLPDLYGDIYSIHN
jgi:hypothetical protein